MAAETIRVVVVNMGAAGVGVPAGGATSQVLAKSSGTSYDTAWVTLTTAGTTVGAALLNLANPSAVTFIRINADNSVTALTAAQFATALGLGTGDSPTFTGATLSGGTLTAPVNVNLTLATSGTGAVALSNGAALQIKEPGGSTNSIAAAASGYLTFTRAGDTGFAIYPGQVNQRAGSVLGWTSSGTNAATSADTGVARASAGVVEINNGTAGTLRDLSLRAIAASGAVSATSYVESAIGFRVPGNLYITSTSDGIVRLLNSSATDFNRLQFGGTTSSFPSLKRSGTGIQVRLADDSGDAPLTVSTIRLAAYTVATLPTPAAGMRAYVTDANATTFMSTVAAGGANVVPVFYDGTNWKIA